MSDTPKEEGITLFYAPLKDSVRDFPYLEEVWGSMFDIPRRTLIRWIVTLADLMTSPYDRDDIDVFERDILQDALEYLYQDHCLSQYGDESSLPEPCSLVNIDDDEKEKLTEMEMRLFQAALDFRRYLGPRVIECHYIDANTIDYPVIAVEIGYRDDTTTPSPSETDKRN